MTGNARKNASGGGSRLGEVDLHLFGEGTHRRLWEVLGAHLRPGGGVDVAVWAPDAAAVDVVGDFDDWAGTPLEPVGDSGVWAGTVDAASGARYKFAVIDGDGARSLRADPMARRAEAQPGTASVVDESTHEWTDGAWLASRAGAPPDRRMSVYEVHLGSWRHPGGETPTYRGIADELAAYVADLGFTHVELLPVAEHPFGGSWGYQVSSYYAPTARFGSPDDFRHLVDILHAAGVGVIVDWVPAHFPRDDWALARFDGTPLYEHADPREGEHPDWGTLVFNVGRNEVRNFLVANALYWIDEFHVDGLRVDAVASMLYRDYSRREGEWVPNHLGGRENLEAVAFFQEVNTIIAAEHPGVLTIAEESTAWPGVSRPVQDGGLGFTHKWNMGWMHDTLDYLAREPVHRRYHHHQLTFGLVYAWSENFVLPLSHDEVVHEKGSMLTKMPGDRWQQLAGLRALYAWMWAHPGKKLLFMGAELAQPREWDHDGELDWGLLDDPEHAGVHALVRELNAVAASVPALVWRDFDPAGFAWVDANDADHSAYAFARIDEAGDVGMLCAANFTPVPRHGYRIGLPGAAAWAEALNTDDERWGGSGIVNERIVAEDLGWHGQERSAVITLPPLAVVWLAAA